MPNRKQYNDSNDQRRSSKRNRGALRFGGLVGGSVGLVGALVTLLTLLKPEINKILDNYKYLQGLQIQGSISSLITINERLKILSEALLNCQEVNKGIAGDAEGKSRKLDDLAQRLANCETKKL